MNLYIHLLKKVIQNQGNNLEYKFIHSPFIKKGEWRRI
jgi:hypothetical protein